MQIITILYTAFCIFTIIFPEKFISELSISFLPYHIAILLILLFLFLYHTKKNISSNKNSIKKRVIIITTLIIWATFITYSQKFKKFYETTAKQIEVTNKTWLKILYANIHKENDNYEGIKKTIEDSNPDMIMFVEFSENHYNHLKSFLKTNYPYINSTTRSRKFIWSMVFSKTPITNRADDFPQWARRYWYFQTKYNQKDYYIYLVHTSSPDDYSHFLMRDQQLDTLWDDIRNQKIHRDNDNVVIVWDFNLSPWSYYYQTFEKKYLSWFYNQTKKIPFLFTWSFRYLPIFKSHIDQLRSTSWVDITNLKSITIPGSDHKWMIFEIQN